MERGEAIRLIMQDEPTSVKAGKVAADEILPEYDFSRAKPGKFAAGYAAGSNVVVLEPDVAAMFPGASEVNEALRALPGILVLNAPAKPPPSRPCPGHRPDRTLIHLT